MAHNPVDNNYKGRVLPNSDGSYDSRYPDGDKPAS